MRDCWWEGIGIKKSPQSVHETGMIVVVVFVKLPGQIMEDCVLYAMEA